MTAPDDGSGPAPVPEPTPRSKRNAGVVVRSNTVQAWTTIALTAMGVVVAIYFGIRATGWPEVEVDPMDIAGTPSALGETAAATPVATSATLADQTPQDFGSPEGGGGDGPCVDLATGASVPCGATSAGLVVAACELEQVLAGWGVDVELESVLLNITEVGAECVAVPSEEAIADGARATDLVAVSNGSISAALRECARGDGSPTVSCAGPHELEWVGPWRDVGSADVSTTCSQAAKSYANHSFAGTSELAVKWLIAQHADGSQTYRCALTVPGESLQGTVRNIGTNPLPVVR